MKVCMGMEQVESFNCLYRVLHEVVGCAVAIILTVLCHGMLLTGTYVKLSVSDRLLCVCWCTIFQVIFEICLRWPDFSVSECPDCSGPHFFCVGMSSPLLRHMSCVSGYTVRSLQNIHCLYFHCSICASPNCVVSA